MGVRSTPFLVVLAAALAVPSLCVWVAGQNPFAAWIAMFGYAFGTVDGFAEVLVSAIPLTLAGLAVAVAFRAGLFNIGADGQIVTGAVLAVALAPVLAPLGRLGLAGFLVAGLLGGGMLGALVGWLRARFGANEIIVTIMLNFVMLQVAGWLIRGPLQEQPAVFPRSAAIPEALILPAFGETTRLHAGLFVALAAVAVMAFVLERTAFGFRLRVLGENADAALGAGYRVPRLVIVALALSGALAGLAGAVEVAGVTHRIEDAFAEGYGATAIAVALLARLRPGMVPLAAILFGGFAVGAGALQRDLSIPFPLVWVLQGTVILVFVAHAALARRKVPGVAA